MFKQSLIVISSFGLLCQAGCASKAERKEIETKFQVTSPLVMDTTIIQDYVCQINSIRHIELRSQEKGYLEKIFVDEGKAVKKGQLLFQILPLLYQADLHKAQAEVSLAEIEYKNTKSLADSNVVSPNELAMAKARLEKVKAELSLTQVHLRFTEIRAPYDGIIDRFHVREGSLINEGDLLTELSDNSQMWVYFNVPEAEYLDYRERVKKDSTIKVNLLMANNKIFPYEGIMETIEANFNNRTGNIPFRATFPNPEELLRHGETGNILIHIPLKQALIIPQKATFEILDKKYVFVVGKDNVIRSREITIDKDMEDIYSVSEGLTANDKILLEGLRKVRDKDKVAYDYVNPRKVISHLKLFAE